MFAWISARLRQPRQPLAGVALGAILGVLLGEVIWRHAGADQSEPTANGTLVLALLLFLAAVTWFVCRPRGWLCAVIVVGGFAVLHLFQSSVVPAIVLARELTPQPGYDTAALESCQAIGYVVDEPRGPANAAPQDNVTPLSAPAAPSWRWTFQLESITVVGASWPAQAQVSVFWRNAGTKPIIGDHLCVVGLAGNVAPPRNPGEFDNAAFLRRRGIYSEVTVNGIADVRPAPGTGSFWLRPWLGPAEQRVHDWIDATLRLDLQDAPDVSRLVTTSLLGLRDDPGLGDLEPLFQRTGMLHFFAIDGLKIGFLGWLLLTALTSSGLARKRARALCLLLLLGYTLAAGIGPATVRAIAVAAVLLGGEWLDRPARPGNSLGAAAAGLLLFDTNQLFTLGFQLSFLVVLAILTLAAPLRDWLWKIGAPDPFLPWLLYPRWLHIREAARRAFVDLTGVSVAAWLGSLPLTILAFHLLAPISILANIVVFPLAATMFGLAAFAVLGGVLWQTWAVWMNNANWLVAKTLLWVLRFFDALPGGSFHVASPEFWHWPPPVAQITVLDLGPGRSLAIQAGRAHWLINTGRAPDYRNVVLPFIQASGVDRLDGLLLTQANADHLGAAAELLTDLQPSHVFLVASSARSPALRSLRDRLAERGDAAAPLAGGLHVVLARDVSLAVLYPPEGLTGGAAARPAVIRVDAAGWRVLLLGDVNAGVLGWLAANAAPADLRSDVVVSGQISASADLKSLLASVHPQLFIQERARESTAAPPPKDRSWTTVSQVDAGAVTLLAYREHLDVCEFLSGPVPTLTKSAVSRRTTLPIGGW
jgi:competence protein ComEC